MLDEIKISEEELALVREKLSDPLILSYLYKLGRQTIQDIAQAIPGEGQSLEDFYRSIRQEQGFLQAVHALHQLGASASKSKVTSL